MLKFVASKPAQYKDGRIVTLSGGQGQGYAHPQGQGRVYQDYGGGVSAGRDLNFNESASYVQSDLPVTQLDGSLSKSDFGECNVGQFEDHNLLAGDENANPVEYRNRQVIAPEVRLYTEHLKAFNKRYGKVGFEKELIPVQQQVESRRGQTDGQLSMDGVDGHVGNIGQRADYPGYPDNFTGLSSPTDVNQNPVPRAFYPVGHGGYSYGGDAPKPRGRGLIRPQSFGPDIGQRQFRHINAGMTGPQHRFTVPNEQLSREYLNAFYDTPYSLDSTGSPSIDSMSMSGDRSSKTTSDTLDYDGVLDPGMSSPKRRLDIKPPMLPAKHRHMHVGRGGHGVCVVPTSLVRPGVIDSHMTSSLRKSPSFRSGHRVRWDPHVVNSAGHRPIEIQPDQLDSTPKRGKKKSSLRTLLNLPKFPIGEAKATDDVDSGAVHKDSTISDAGKLKFMENKSFDDSTATKQALASMRYKSDMYQSDNEEKENVPNLSRIYSHQQQLDRTSVGQSHPSMFYPCHYSSDNFGHPQNVSMETSAINHPIMHSGYKLKPFDVKPVPVSGSRSPVNSVRPFLVNGKSREEEGLDYDNFDKPPQSDSHAINVSFKNVGSFSQDNITSRSSRPLRQPHRLTMGRDTSTSPTLPGHSSPKVTVIHSVSDYGGGKVQNVDLKRPDHSLSGINIPVTFDTFVTLPRPTASSLAAAGVSFDTFVTLGRPYATSTPVPNGNVRLDNEKHGKDDGLTYSYASGVTGPFSTNVTQSWNYGRSVAPSVPTQSQEMYGKAVESLMASSGHVTSQAMPHGHVTQGRVSDDHVTNGPYFLENKAYGRLTAPSQTYITHIGGPPAYSSSVTYLRPKIPLEPTVILHNPRNLSQVFKPEPIAGYDTHVETSQSQFKDAGFYHEKEHEDYDDDLFANLTQFSTPHVDSGQTGNIRTARRRLEFEDAFPSNVMTSCVPQLNHDLNHDTVNNTGYPRVQVVPGISQRGGGGGGGNMSNLNDMINRPQERVVSGDMDHILDLVYITERIISMSFASEEHETTYKGNLKEVTRMLKTKHGDNYLVINISDKRPDLAKHCPQVLDYGWPDHLAPPLERLCSVCKAIDSWLGSDINHVVVVHCKGGRGRIAVVIAAYMRYSNICASADQALDRFAMKRFYDDKLGGLPQPSQRRYVHYFAGLLSGAIQINSSALYLHHILIHGVPNFDTKGGCRPFIKVYQGMHPIFTSGVYNVTDNMQKVCISISPGIPLRGDILIKCYHKKNKAGQREIMWGCQFHTCAISHNSLVFSKNELDEAINDPRFPDTGKVEFVFGNNSEGLVQVSDFKSDVTVPVDDTTDALTRWDSYENFSKHVEGKETDVNANGLPESKSSGAGSFRVASLDHSQGPVDGNLYAQVQKQNALENQILQNGPSKLHNGGSFASSLDSVPMGTLTQKSNISNESWSREVKEQPSFSSYTQKSYSSTSSAPRSRATKEEQSQLDQILSDLLNDQAFVSQKSPSGRTYSSETRSFKTVEDHMSPEGNVVVQRSDVTYKVPEVKKEEHYTMKTQTKTMTEDSKSSYRPVNAFTYTPQSPEQSRSFEPIRSPRSPGSPRGYSNKYNKNESYSYKTGGSGSLSDGEHSLSWLQQQQQKLRDRSEERDPHREHQEKMIINELKSAQASNKFKQRSMSEDESTSESFKKSVPLTNGPASPYSYTVSRTHTYSTDKSPSEKDAPFRAQDSIPITQSHTTYSTQFQTDSHGSKISNKPPPSPIQRTVTPTLNVAPIPPPQRTSSKDYMQYQQNRNRSNSTTQAEPHVMQRHYSETASSADRIEKELLPRSYSQTPPAVTPRAGSPQTYQTYRTVYKTMQHDKDQPDFARPQMSPPPVEVQIERQMESKPQLAPTNKPHYITEVFVNRSTGSDPQSGTLDRADSEKRLEALEKSLQAAQASIIAQTPWPQQQQQVQKSEEVRRYETRSYETKSEQMNQNQQPQQQMERQIIQQHQEAPPAPKKLEVTEEDRITLKPIGPGVHQLEPEGVHTGTLGRESSNTSTLGRATTPSFPTSPAASAEMFIQSVHEKARRMSLGSRDDLHGRSFHATPPFPVTPKTPYQNTSVSSSPYRLVSESPSSNWYSTLDNRSSTPDTLRAATPDSVFERDLAYNTVVSRQLMRSSDPLYASIPENVGGNRPTVGGSQIAGPTGTLTESQRMQYQTYNQQQQNYQSAQTLPPQQTALSAQIQPGFQTLPQQSAPPSFGQMQPAFSTLPHQTQQQQQLQQQQQQTQQNQQQQYHYQTEQKQQYHTQQHSQQQFSSGTIGSQFSGAGAQQNGSLHIDTNPRMIGSYPSKSPSSPGSPSNLDTLRQQLHIAHNMSGSAVSPGPQSATGQSSPSVYFGLSRRGSLTSLADSEAVHTTPKFVKDTSKYWYKPNITREEAIVMLKDKAPGTFVVRDSNSFPGAFGLALKVAQIPANVQAKSTGDPMADLVRHFLIEPTPKGVRLRGCSNEPVFGSLAALVYQHSMTPLALPCKLVLPEHDAAHIVGDITPSDVSMTSEVPSSASALLAQGAACNVLFLNTVDTESLTGPQAVARASKLTFDYPPPKVTQVHFKVSNQGITLTDNQRKLFFRRHYPVAAVTYCGMDPEDRKWKRETDVPGVLADAKVFGFVARKQGGVSDNACHLFAELDPDQPASAIVNFVTKIMIGQSKIKS